MRKDRAFDVVVIGAGVTGLAAAGALARAGGVRVAVSRAGGAAGPVSAAAAGLALGGQVDNFTRVSHALGMGEGSALWRFGDLAFDALAGFCEAEGVPLARGQRVRLITSPQELTEAEQAVRELQAAGLGGTLTVRGRHALAPLLTERVLAVQDDGPRAAWVDARALLAKLEEQAQPAAGLAAVTRLDSSGPVLRLELADGSVATCEFAILAAHLGIKTLVPQLSDCLVSVADQWSEVALAPAARAPSSPAGAPDLASLTGFCWSANHTYEWGTFAPSHLALGGGRYLRPLAGFEAETAPREPKIVSHLMQQLARTFSFAAGATAGPTHAALDIRPCDERPLIGPVAGEGRLLVAAGYGGQGLTLGFLAGQCLAELVQTGRSPRLPRSLSPERFRSLEP